MLRKIVRVLAILFLLGSVALGLRATYLWLTPSDEQEIYDKKFQEAMGKVQRAEAARGTAAEARLMQEAKEAIASADIWRRAAGDRLWWNRVGSLVNGSLACFSFLILLLTFIKPKPAVEFAQPNAWNTNQQNLPYGARPGFDEAPPPGH